MSRPPPLITKTAKPFWDGLREEKIVLQHCVSCKRWIFYPRILCPYCASTELIWDEPCGEATLYSFTVAHYPISPDFTETPCVVAMVDLKEGVRLPVALRDADPDTIRIGARMRPVFDNDGFDGITVLSFIPV